MNYVNTPAGISGTIEGRSFNVGKTSPDYSYVLWCCKNRRKSDLLNRLDKLSSLREYVNPPKLAPEDADDLVRAEVIPTKPKTVVVGDVTVTEDDIYYRGKPLHNTLVDRILELMRANEPFEYMVKFLNNLGANPSYHAVNEAYDFLKHSGLPLTDDGCFLAYKAVRGNYLDKHSGTIENKPGTRVSVPRNTVDDNRDRQCSYGLHVGHLRYAKDYFSGNGDIILLVKVNPAHIVSVPTDHSCMKCRVSEYDVICEYKSNEPLDKPLYTIKDLEQM